MVESSYLRSLKDCLSGYRVDGTCHGTVSAFIISPGSIGEPRLLVSSRFQDVWSEGLVEERPSGFAVLFMLEGM